MASNAFGVAGTVTQKFAPLSEGFATVTFTCTGGTAGDAGTIPNTAMATDTFNYLTTRSAKGWYLYSVTAFPTAGGTAPDAASVFVLEGTTGLYLLGSEDGGTTAYGGLNLIHATLAKSTFPNKFLTQAGTHKDYFPELKYNLTLIVADQATASANWTIVFTFVQ